MELDFSDKTDNPVTIEDVGIACHDLAALDGLHADVAAVLFGGIRDLSEPHRIPTVRDEDLVTGVDRVCSIDDETRDVAQRVDVIWAEMVLAIRFSSLEADLGSGFAGATIEDDLFHASVAGVVVDQSSEELIGQSSSNLGSSSSLLALLQGIDARFDEVGDAIKLVLPVLRAVEEHLANGMVGSLVSVASVEDKVGKP